MEGGEEGGRRGGRRGGRTRGRSNARGRGTGRPHRAIPRKGEEVGTKKSPVDCKAAVDGDREPQKKARRGPAPVAPGRAALHKLSALLRQEHAGLRRPDPAQLTPPHAHQPAERSTSIAGVGAAGVGAAGEGAAGVGTAGVGAARVGTTGVGAAGVGAAISIPVGAPIAAVAFFGGLPTPHHEEVVEEGRLTGERRRRHGNASGGGGEARVGSAGSARGRGRSE